MSYEACESRMSSSGRLSPPGKERQPPLPPKAALVFGSRQALRRRWRCPSVPRSFCRHDWPRLPIERTWSSREGIGGAAVHAMVLAPLSRIVELQPRLKDNEHSIQACAQMTAIWTIPFLGFLRLAQ